MQSQAALKQTQTSAKPRALPVTNDTAPERNTEPQPKTIQKKEFARDSLTGLHGEAYLCRAIDECLTRSRSRGLSATLALLQLENFYEIRHWVGKPEADQLLSDIARLLKKALPSRVLLCRCHNYEFAALLVGDSSANAGLITDKLKQALLSAVSPVLPRQLELKCGVGLASLDSNIPSWPVVFARARHNLSLGHHHSELPTQLAAVGPEFALRQLHRALQRPELALNFQAWANFRESAHRHYEVRCSLAGESAKLPTALLFETAARNALGEQIDRRIIEQLLKQLMRLIQLKSHVEPQLRLIVNLSHNSVVSIAFLRWLETRLSDERSLAQQLIFQISETDALIAQHHLMTFCEAVQRLGCRLSLSNFGCTPNPLRYLSLVSASYVKLDAGLLRNIDANLDSQEKITALGAELHERQIAVVAPMLERLSSLPALWQARVDYLQGKCLHECTSSMEYEFLKTQTLSFD